ncbi:MAG: hypothetical protein IJZ16_07270 [Clostridia bacterium]|nr:hypothetical protein [Clostridia bacterium]
MSEFTGTIKDLSLDYKTGKAILTLELNERNNATKMYDKLNQVDKLAIEIDKYKEKRSNEANAYCWVLCGKIADCVGASKDEIYLEMLKRYGQTFVSKIQNQKVELFKRSEKYWEEHESLEAEEKAQYFRVWVGSSNYNTEEMSIFINGIISEAEELDIDVRTPDQIAEMMSLWESDNG